MHPTTCEICSWDNSYDKTSASCDLALKNHTHCEYISDAYTYVNVCSQTIYSYNTSKLSFCSSPTILIEYDDLSKTLKFTRI